MISISSKEIHVASSLLDENDLLISKETLATTCESSRNVNTKRKYQWAKKKFLDFLNHKKLQVKSLHEYKADDLTVIVPNFIVHVTENTKNKSKTVFELVMALQQAINEERLLFGLDRFSFLNDKEFALIPRILDHSLKQISENNFQPNKRADIIEIEM